MVTKREPRPAKAWSATSCPVCGAEVRPAIKGRRKSMGTWIPVWGPGPCRNPECTACAEAAEAAPAESPADGGGPADEEPVRKPAQEA